LFAVFDGHGGTFAAAYAGRNLCRVLSRQPKFALYAEFERSRPQEEKVLTTATDRAKFFRTGLALLEASLCDAFVDLDREIAQALKGVKVPEADKPYHPPPLGNHRRPTSTLMVPSNQHCEDVRILTTTATGASMVVEEEGSSCSTALPDGTTATPSTGASSLTVQRNVADGSGFGNHPDDEDDDEDDPSASPSDSALQLLEEEGDSGTTACVVIVTPHYVLCANAGDSRAVISRLSHRAVPLSYDHKPDDEGEERRIRAAGGYVAGGRVEGDLAVSRGLGDFRFKNMNTVMAATSAYRYGESDTAGATASSTSKPSSPASFPGSVLFPQGGSSQQQQLMKPGDQKVSPIPDVVIQARNPGQDEFILVACDGIWDVLTNYEAVQTIAELFKEGETNLGLICEEVRA
jgi:serine/threonine protein phosphatase PrpC